MRKRRCRNREAPAALCSSPCAAAAPEAGEDAAPSAPSAERGVRDLSAYVDGKEQDYFNALSEALQRGAWEPTYLELKRENASSPSFFLYAAGILLAHSRDLADEAVRVCTNCLEMSLQDVQMMRSVGYFLLKAGWAEQATAVFDRVRDLAPGEPQSFLDGALVRFLRLRQSFDDAVLREAVRLAAVTITHAWADRFQEVEWPALVLLHLLVEFAEARGLRELWSIDAAWRIPNFSVGLVIWLAWDTDKTDIDLHVVEPSGNEVYYSAPRSPIGGLLSKDFTQGYGPEVYLLKNPPAGTYVVKAKYYASHQQSGLTGATSAVLWSLKGGAADGGIDFHTIRLDRNKEKMDVMSVVIEGDAGSA